MVWQTVWRVARIGLGLAFLVLGGIGLFLPFLQGILFIIIGLTFLSRDSCRARQILDWMNDRFRIGRRAETEAIQQKE